MHLNDSEDPAANISFQVPQTIEEPSLEDAVPNDISYIAEDGRLVEYTIVENGSQKGGLKLADSNGYTYTVKKRRKNGQIDWACSIRNKVVWCKASLKQNGMSFVRGPQPHIHTGIAGAKEATEIRAEIKNTAAKEVFTSSSQIVKKVLLEKVAHGQPLVALPNLDNLGRAVNRHRQSLRPKEPKTLEELVHFEVDEAFISRDFLRSTVTVGQKKHFIFATDTMLTLLKLAKTWYMDGTFKVVKTPFTQLFSIHSFVRQEKDIKQVPLMFCLMSGRKKKDYKKVLKEIKELLAQNDRDGNDRTVNL